MIPLLNGYAPPQQEIINLINEKKPAVVEQVKEPTLEEKIATNFYRCNEEIEWIRADNAQCLPKQIPTSPTPSVASEPRTAPTTGSVGLNGYEPGQCTAHVASKRYVPAGWGDATNWHNAALRAGWIVSRTPVAGAIGWRYGHVVYVIEPRGETVLISEQNYDWNSGIRTIEVPVSEYVYLYQ